MTHPETETSDALDKPRPQSLASVSKQRCHMSGDQTLETTNLNDPILFEFKCRIFNFHLQIKPVMRADRAGLNRDFESRLKTAAASVLIC